MNEDFENENRSPKPDLLNSLQRVLKAAPAVPRTSNGGSRSRNTASRSFRHASPALTSFGDTVSGDDDDVVIGNLFTSS